MQRITLGLILSSLLVPCAQATWSLAKLEPERKSIVVAGASCSFMVYGIATVVPGKGVAIVQAASNAEARGHAATEIGNGTPLATIQQQLTNPATFADHAEQQFALLAFAEWQTPRSHTGNLVAGVHGVKTAPGISVQANTMVNEKIVPAVFAAMTEKTGTDLALAKQALQALQAGSVAGGDNRCGKATAATAFLTLYRDSDNVSMPYLNLVVYGIEPGTRNAVDVLAAQFDRWLKADAEQRSSQVFVSP